MEIGDYWAKASAFPDKKMTFDDAAYQTGYHPVVFQDYCQQMMEHFQQQGNEEMYQFCHRLYFNLCKGF